MTLIGDDDSNYLATPTALGNDDAMLPPPDPKLFASYDGAMGEATAGTRPAPANRRRTSSTR